MGRGGARRPAHGRRQCRQALSLGAAARRARNSARSHHHRTQDSRGDGGRARSHRPRRLHRRRWVSLALNPSYGLFYGAAFRRPQMRLAAELRRCRIRINRPEGVHPIRRCVTPMLLRDHFGRSGPCGYRPGLPVRVSISAPATWPASRPIAAPSGRASCSGGAGHQGGRPRLSAPGARRGRRRRDGGTRAGSAAAGRRLRSSLSPMLRRALALAAAKFFPSQPAVIAAVTGTSGKTSVAAFTRQIWAALGHQAASIGTVGVVSPAGDTYGSLTTPDPVELHQHTRPAGARRRHPSRDRGVVPTASTSTGWTGCGSALPALPIVSRDHLDSHPERSKPISQAKLVCSSAWSRPTVPR